MIKTKTKNKTKMKVPKIEINECKMKTKDQKKLENEMFQQAKDAQILLEKLLCEGDEEDYREGRARSNSLNATMENLLLTRHKADIRMKPRGSVPNIAANISRKLFFRNNRDNNSQTTSPLSSPELSHSPRSINPMKYMRKHAEADINTSDVRSPKHKRKVIETENGNASCTSFKPMITDSDISFEENNQPWKEKLI